MMRRIQFAILATVLVVAALSTGADFLFFLLYLGLLVVGGAYLLTRTGLAGLEAGYVLDRPQAQVGDFLRAVYTVRNTSLLPKVWLEVSNWSQLPIPLPGRALALRPRTESSWVARVPLTRRGHYRVDPLVLRTSDPIGLFETSASVGASSTIIVYPQVEPLIRWHLPAATLEGSQANAERSLQTTAMVTSIRPYVPGDAYNRIHWRSTARQQELQVKEFDLEQTADVWLFVDLDATFHTGSGDFATIETAVRATASIGARALSENRALGLTAVGRRRAGLPADRGPRQQQKMLQLLAAVEPEDAPPLAEVLSEGLPRLRRGMTALVITPSHERDWVRPLTSLRRRGIGVVVCIVDSVSHEARSRRALSLPELSEDEREMRAREVRAVRYAAAEHELKAYLLLPGIALGDQLVSAPLAAGARP
ncbi:hypothetical protein BH18CHL1_BH18CHL1_05570 [soil metagenome]